MKGEDPAPPGADVTRAAELLVRGGIVAFPTETVYGLGADARNEDAVLRVFRIKARPRSHPLIVHLGSSSVLGEWAAAVPPAAERLAERFWPGPLTLVLAKAARVPGVVTGGQETIGLRVPAHPLALALLGALGSGIAAPSANRFGAVSPTTAEHVRADLGSDVDFVLDGGPCTLGIESTIVSLVAGDPVILRPGGTPREAIEELVGFRVPVVAGSEVRVPGSLEQHYAPRAELVLVAREERAARAAALRGSGRRVVVLSDDEVEAHRLYASLRRADASGAEVIVASLPGEAGLGLGVADRLRKAAGPRR